VALALLPMAGLPPHVELQDLPVSAHAINLSMFLVELAMSLFILYVGIRAKKPLIVLLILAQAGLMVWFELGPERIWRWRRICLWTSSPSSWP